MIMILKMIMIMTMMIVIMIMIMIILIVIIMIFQKDLDRIKWYTIPQSLQIFPVIPLILVICNFYFDYTNDDQILTVPLFNIIIIMIIPSPTTRNGGRGY